MGFDMERECEQDLILKEMWEKELRQNWEEDDERRRQTNNRDKEQ